MTPRNVIKNYTNLHESQMICPLEIIFLKYNVFAKILKFAI